MKAKREQMDEELRVIKLFASNYARDLMNINAITNVTSTKSNDLNNVFNCMTQKVNRNSNFTLADAFACYDNTLPGAQKYLSKPYQNPDLNHLTSIRPISTNAHIKTVTTGNTVNSILWNPLNDVGKNKSSLITKTSADDNIFSSKPSVFPKDVNSPSKALTDDKVHMHSKNKAKDDTISSKHSSKNPPDDGFLKSTEKLNHDTETNLDPNLFNRDKNDNFAWNTNNGNGVDNDIGSGHDNSELSFSLKTKTHHIFSANHMNQDISNHFASNKKINKLNNSINTAPFNMKNYLKQLTDNSFNSDPMFRSLDLPFAD